MNYVQYVKRHLNISLPTIWHDLTNHDNPDLFKPNGSQIYHGYQGEGKSLSMYHATKKLKARYPRAILVSNLTLSGYHPVRILNKSGAVDESRLQALIAQMDASKHYIYYESYDELITLLRNCRNGDYGVIFNIDEIHNYFHSHDSKNMPMWVVQVFSQQRKQKLLILGTVQDWEDLIKAIRRQIDNLIECHRVGYFIFQAAVDPRTAEMQYGERMFTIRKKGMFFISKKLREGTDTYHVIDSGREILGGADLEPVKNLTRKGAKKAVKANKITVNSAANLRTRLTS